MLPLDLNAGDFESSIQRRGIVLGYSSVVVVLDTTLVNMVDTFRTLFQYRKGSDLDVTISNTPECVRTLTDIFENNLFISDMSVELPLLEHLTNAFAIELSKVLGIRALGSSVGITSPAFLNDIANNVVTNFLKSSTLPKYLVEQFMIQSSERFGPGKYDTYQGIPFEPGDTLSFFLTLTFEQAMIENCGFHLSKFLNQEELPKVELVIRFSFSS